MTRVRKFRAVPESVPAARRFVRDALRDQSRELIQAAELMTSELATNCVQHAHTDFELAVRMQDQIRVEVRDTDQHQPEIQFPKPEDQSGRGLRIVEAMSDTWGVIPSQEGKTVWFELESQPAASDREQTAAAINEQRSDRGGRPDRQQRMRGGGDDRRRWQGEASRAEAGCIDYRLYQDTENDDQFVFVEEWESEQALQQHFTTAHIAQFMRAVPAALVAPPDVKFHEVASTRDLSDVSSD